MNHRRSLEKMAKINFFISYSHKDVCWFEEGPYDLIPFLMRSLQMYDVEFWFDHALKKMPGIKYKDEIKAKIDNAHFAILLISQEFVNSDFIRQFELPWIKKRVEKKELSIIPILVKPVVWRQFNQIQWINERQILPGKPTPLINYTRDIADWETVRNEILDAVINMVAPNHKIPKEQVERKDGVIKMRPKSGTNFRRKLTMTSKTPLLVVIMGFFVVAILSIFVIWPHIKGKSYEEKVSIDLSYIHNRDAFLGGIPWMNWILYTPTEYNPYTEQEASEASIRKDLQVLRKYAFNGLITMTAGGTARKIPRVAHEEGFKLVIMTVWDLRNEEEVENALKEADWADAYCIGHRGLNKRYTIGELQLTMEKFRREAKRPVSTSEVILEYETNPMLIEIGDFLFPDVHTLWHHGMDAKTVWNETIELAQKAAAAVSNTNQLVLLKMISYPSEGAKGLTEESQKRFYRMVIEESQNRIDIPARVSFSFLCAFDPLWKVKEYGWADSEKYTGLFSQDRHPKPAVMDLNWQIKR